MKLILDNIIFSLQKWGGISVYWSELLKRIDQLEQDDTYFFLEVKKKQISSSLPLQLSQVINLVKSNNPLFLVEQYRNPVPILKSKHIFHSSYYRVSRNPLSRNITTVHDFTYETHFSGFKKWIHIFQKSRALKKSNGIICISEYTKDLMFKLYPFTKNKHVEVIYNGISENFISEEKIKFDLPFEKNKYILFIGDRKSAYKNFKLTCKVVKNINKPLVIVGGGEITSSEIHFLKGIKFHTFNFLEEKQLKEVYRNAFCLLYPSVSEGFGIPILEAQICRCPVVTSNKTCIPEISGGYAEMIDELNVSNLSSAIIKLEDIEYRNFKTEKGKENALKFHWQSTIEKTFLFYKKILEL
jgi:glycosyltransferase involved in cell wall biosynthesis